VIQNDTKKLLAWYAEVQRDLPWRQTDDPYSVMVSEFMLQQTTVAAVVPKYDAWMKRFPTIQALSDSEVEDVLYCWSGLGYYQRARRLHSAAQHIVHSGSVPTTVEGLLELPGFGSYTAAAVASICFGRPELAVDTNVIRVLYRYYGLRESPSERKAHALLRSNMKPAFEWAPPGDLNQALMELGATHCSVKTPDCSSCPIRTHCCARVCDDGPEAFPSPTLRKPIAKTPGVVLLLELISSREVLLVKGTSLGLLKDLHQPPILFAGEGNEHPIHRAAEVIAQELESHSKEQRWHFSYGISGRRLELDTVHAKLSRETMERFESILCSQDISHARVSSADLSGQGDRRGLPISSLTRRALKKWLENL